MENPSQDYGASPAIRDHTELLATRHRWTRPALTPARQTSTRLTYPWMIKGWVDLGVGYIPRRFTCPQTVTHPSSNRLIATRPGPESNLRPHDCKFDTKHQAKHNETSILLRTACKRKTVLSLQHINQRENNTHRPRTLYYRYHSSASPLVRLLAYVWQKSVK